MWGTFREGLTLVRGSPVLLMLLGVTVLAGSARIARTQPDIVLDVRATADGAMTEIRSRTLILATGARTSAPLAALASRFCSCRTRLCACSSIPGETSSIPAPITETGIRKN